MSSIFDEPTLHIEQTNWNAYTGQFEFNILDRHGRTLATVREPKQHLWTKVFYNVVGTPYSARHFMHVDDPDGEPLFAIDKHNRALGESMSIQLPNVGEVGRLKKVHWDPTKRHFKVVDRQQGVVADILSIPKGAAWKTWNFRVVDSGGTEIAEMLESDPNTLMSRPGLDGNFTLRAKVQLPHEMRVLLAGAFVGVNWFDAQWLLD